MTSSPADKDRSEAPEDAFGEALIEYLDTSATSEVRVEKDRSELAAEQGFTGTFAGFIEWLTGSLVYGGVIVHDPAPNNWGRMSVVVETVTGGYSSDETLLGRLRRYWRMQHHWVRSERGGLTVYEFSVDEATSTTEHVWLEPDDGVFERLMRARRVRVYDSTGSFVEFSYEHGAELVFEEPDRDINEPDGTVTVRPAPSVEALFGTSDKANR